MTLIVKEVKDSGNVIGKEGGEVKGADGGSVSFPNCVYTAVVMVMVVVLITRMLESFQQSDREKEQNICQREIYCSQHHPHEWREKKAVSCHGALQ